ATDENHAVFEYLFEDNNVGLAAAPLEIAQTPNADLATSDVLAPAIAVAGEPTTISWTASNLGDGATGDGTPSGTVSTWTDRVVLSQNAIYGDSDDRLVADIAHHGALAPNGTYQGTFSGALPAGISGVYRVFVATDSTDQVYERLNSHTNVAQSAGTIDIA